MATLANTLAQSADVIICVDPLDVHARGHDVGDRTFADAEDSLEQLLLNLLQQSGFLARGYQQLQFLRR
jgi:hypothetical protein